MTASAQIEQDVFEKVKKGAIVLFAYQGRVWDGNVIRVDRNISPPTATLVWLEGHSTRTEYVPVEEILSMYDKSAPEMRLGDFRGPGVLLPAGIQWQKDHPSEHA